MRVNDKVMIPQDEHPEINFVGLLIGPRGNTLKNLEKDVSFSFRSNHYSRKAYRFLKPLDFIKLCPILQNLFNEINQLEKHYRIRSSTRQNNCCYGLMDFT